MPLPAPNLDDRSFQDLVDDAKRMVQQRCPSWTDHNVSDPGVTLIETFAFMVDTLLYRLNRVPDRLYVKFLDLIGLRLNPPTAARADVTFWLTAPATEPIPVPEGTVVATHRTESDEAICFSTVGDLTIVPCTRTHVFVAPTGATMSDVTATIESRAKVDGFSNPPQPGDVIMIGLDEPVPSMAVALRLACEIDGVGVDPRRPPLRWEAWTGSSWSPCEVDRDDTGGLNRDGDVVLHIPRDHAASVIERTRAGWLRCVVTEPEEGQPFYSAPPRISRIDASTLGGTTATVNAETVTDDVLGTSTGVAGQQFQLSRFPVIPAEFPLIVDVSDDRDGWQEWSVVADFADSGPSDHHVTIDHTLGVLAFGPVVRNEDGSLTSFGATPEKGTTIRVRAYRSGGGRRGNVATGSIAVLKSSNTAIGRVENRGPGTGGVDGETIEDAKVRGPIALRSRNRAVTVGDYEYLAGQAAPEIARVRAVADDAEPGVVRVQIVPAVGNDGASLRFEHLVPDEETLATIATFLDERRTIGARVVVEPPSYQGITVVARIRARPGVATDRLRSEAIEALHRHFHPLVGGPDGSGWPFGRPVMAGEVHAVLQTVQGTELVDDVRLFPANPRTGERGDASSRIEPGAHALVFSYQHQVQVSDG